MDTQAQPVPMMPPKQSNALPGGAVRNQARPQLPPASPPNTRAATNDNRVSVDPMRPTDRYRLVVPYELRP